MSDESDNIIEMRARTTDDGVVFESTEVDAPPQKPSLWRKVKAWLMIGSAVALGAVAFVFFLGLFLYVILPIALIFLLWSLISGNRPKMVIRRNMRF